MIDETEDLRRELVQVINVDPRSRAGLELQHGAVWDTDQMREDFEVLGFLAPFCVVRRRADGKKGSLTFQHSPRFYFDWVEDT